MPWLGRSPAEGHDNPLPYSCLEKSMDREAYQATVCETVESDMTAHTHTYTHTHTHTHIRCWYCTCCEFIQMYYVYPLL